MAGLWQRFSKSPASSTEFYQRAFSEQHANEDVTVGAAQCCCYLDIKPAADASTAGKNTPGSAHYVDDEETVIQRQLWADLVI